MMGWKISLLVCKPCAWGLEALRYEGCFPSSGSKKIAWLQSKLLVVSACGQMVKKVRTECKSSIAVGGG